MKETISVVDLQSLGLNYIQKKGNALEIGATTTLQQIIDSGLCPDSLVPSIQLEAPLNLRNSASVAGSLVTSDGRSTLATAFLALDARIEIMNTITDTQNLNIGDFLPLRPTGLITRITIPLNILFTFEDVSRTPSDKPIISAALAQWGQIRARLAIGGWGKAPTLATDGTPVDDLDQRSRAALRASSDLAEFPPTPPRTE